ncbi:AAA domain-containing protein [Meloidogyne graminicola]|uniref:AAA domain-containing protein n=1 Tax=Meloidogyne graminicola TaxID=189291 RepID=A0A8S9ZVP8_9BILA|nr:AAA domain-containing protein [Meloidogyne graminicola]
MDQPSDKIISAIIKSTATLLSTGIVGYITLKVISSFDLNSEKKKEAKKRMEELKALLKLEPKESLNEHELRLATQIVLPESGVDMEVIGGCSEILAQIEDNVILPLLIQASNITIPSAYYDPPKGILLHGPPGCGKTLIARAIAKKAKANFLNFDISMLNDMWYGETSKLTKALFTLCKKIQPCIVFIDEIDSVLRSRSSHDHEATAVMKTQFMTLWDGFAQSDNSVIIIGATNRPEDLDSAVLRRLPFKINVPKPDLVKREEIIKILLKNENLTDDFDYKKVATSTDGMSGSDLKEIVRDACLSKYKDVAKNILNKLELYELNNVQISHEDILKSGQKFTENGKNLKSHFRDELNLD